MGWLIFGVLYVAVAAVTYRSFIRRWVAEFGDADETDRSFLRGMAALWPISFVTSFGVLPWR